MTSSEAVSRLPPTALLLPPSDPSLSETSMASLASSRTSSSFAQASVLQRHLAALALKTARSSQASLGLTTSLIVTISSLFPASFAGRPEASILLPWLGQLSTKMLSLAHCPATSWKTHPPHSHATLSLDLTTPNRMMMAMERKVETLILLEAHGKQ
jgi:hypothetical protein